MSADVGVVDLGTGNLFSVLRGLERAGAAPRLVRDRSEILSTPRLVLPGVGSFRDAAGRAHALGLGELLREAVGAGVPLLGICLGMQLLFDEGDEDGGAKGLGLIPGRVARLRGEGVTVPHVGWQQVRVERACALVPEGERPWLYFSHSFRAHAGDADVSATVEHGETIPAIVARGLIFGLQPHPEKSGRDGEAVLRRFLSLGDRP